MMKGRSPRRGVQTLELGMANRRSWTGMVSCERQEIARRRAEEERAEASFLCERRRSRRIPKRDARAAPKKSSRCCNWAWRIGAVDRNGLANARMAPNEAGQSTASRMSTVRACTPVGSTNQTPLVRRSANRYRFEITKQFLALFISPSEHFSGQADQITSNLRISSQRGQQVHLERLLPPLQVQFA